MARPMMAILAMVKLFRPAQEEGKVTIRSSRSRALDVARAGVLLSLIAAFSACGGGETETPATDGAAPADGAVAAADGRQLYQTCASCHGAEGAGMPGAFPPLANSEWVTGNADVPIRIVLHGMSGPVTVAGNQYNSIMLPYGGGTPLSDEQIAAVLTYVRSSWGNNAPAVTAQDVARVRSETSGRSQQWTADELRPML